MPRRQRTPPTIDASELAAFTEQNAGNPELIKKLKEQVLYIEKCARELEAAKKEAKEARQVHEDAVDALIVMCKGDQKGLFDDVAGELTAEELDA